MKNNELVERLILKYYNELSEDELHALDQDLKGSNALSNEEKSVTEFSAHLAGHNRLEVTDDLLNEARLELRAALRVEQRKRTEKSSFFGSIEEFFTPNIRLAGSAIALVIVGIVVGRYVLESPATVQLPLVLVSMEKASVVKGDTRIANVRFYDANTVDGNVDFEFETVTPVRMRGNVSDAEVQRVLAFALLNEQNPGVRISAVNMISVKTQDSVKTDPLLRKAIIEAAKYDENDGVRRQAINTMAQMIFGDDIRNAYLFVIQNDVNAGMRIAALNNLERAIIDGHRLNEQSMQMLGSIGASDKNQYIRTRVVALVEEAKKK
jgi:hypothetical protein